MVQKQNRKKQLRKNSREKKIVSIYDYDFEDDLNDFPADIFDDFDVENKNEEIQNRYDAFDIERFATMQYLENFGQASSFQHVLEYTLDLVSHPEKLKPEYRELLEILEEENSSKRQERLEAYIRDYPYSLNGKYAHLVFTIDIFDVGELDRIEALCEEAKAAWKRANFVDYSFIEHKEKLEIFSFAVHYYISHGFFGRALECVQYLIGKRLDTYPPRFINMALCLYNQLFRYDLLQSYYQTAKKFKKVDDVLLFHMSIAEFLRGNRNSAADYFQELRELNPFTDQLFIDIDWVEEIEDLETELETYLPNSKESLQLGMYVLWPFIAQRPFLFEFIMEQVDSNLEEVMEDYNLFATYHLSESPALQGIGYDKIRIFNLELGIQKVEDFSKYTEKELLSLKGIGAVTIRTLKNNGVVFK